MPKNRPQKPDVPLVVFALPPTGRVRREVEHPPRDQAELETLVGRKFMAAMNSRGRLLADLQRGSEPDDLTFREGPNLVRVQVAEVVDRAERDRADRSSRYSARLLDEHASVLDSFRGRTVTILESPEQPVLPALRLQPGEAAYQDLVAALSELAEKAGSREPDVLSVERVRIGSPPTELSLICEPGPGGPDAPVVLHWPGASRVGTVGVPEGFLADTIAGKLAKHYDKPKESFWLLTYSTGLMVLDEAVEMEAARALLRSGPNPFDEVWYALPMPNEDGAILMQVWPE